MKRGIVYICLVIWFAWLISAFPVCGDVCAEKVYMTVETSDEFYSAAAAMSTKFLHTGYIRIPFRLGVIYAEKVSQEGIKIDAYAGGNLRAFFCEMVERRDGYFYYDLRFEYYMTASQIRKVDRRTKQIAAQLYGLSDYEKVKAVHDYLVLNCEYKYFKDGPYNALFCGSSNCNGYALAFQKIMNELNIPCRYHTGDVHAWNSVFLDGKWYNIDVTWDDPGGRDVEYLYFLQCNQLWDEHPYGSSDAERNYPLTGTLEHYSFPPYNLFFYGIRVLLIAAAVTVVILVVRRMRYGKTVYLVYNH